MSKIFKSQPWIFNFYLMYHNKEKRAISTSSYGVRDNTFLYVSLFITWIIRFELFVKELPLS